MGHTTYCFVFVLSVLDGESLQRCFFNKLRDVCFEWQKQLPPLRPLKRFLLVSIHAIRNTRRKMEDRHVLLPEFNQLFGLSVSLDKIGEAGLLAFQPSCKHSDVVMDDLWNGKNLLPQVIYHVCAGARTYWLRLLGSNYGPDKEGSCDLGFHVISNIGRWEVHPVLCCWSYNVLVTEVTDILRKEGGRTAVVQVPVTEAAVGLHNQLSAVSIPDFFQGY